MSACVVHTDRSAWRSTRTAVRGLSATFDVYCVNFGVVNVVISELVVPAGATVVKS
jgi:hypothetical protein